MVGQRREMALSQIQALTAFPIRPARTRFPQKTVPAKNRSRPFNPRSRRCASLRRCDSDSLTSMSFFFRLLSRGVAPCCNLCGLSARIPSRAAGTRASPQLRQPYRHVFLFRTLSRGVAPCIVLCGPSARILSSCALSVRPVLSRPFPSLTILLTQVSARPRRTSKKSVSIRSRPFNPRSRHRASPRLRVAA